MHQSNLMVQEASEISTVASSITSSSMSHKCTKDLDDLSNHHDDHLVYQEELLFLYGERRQLVDAMGQESDEHRQWVLLKMWRTSADLLQSLEKLLLVRRCSLRICKKLLRLYKNERDEHIYQHEELLPQHIYAERRHIGEVWRRRCEDWQREHEEFETFNEEPLIEMLRRQDGEWGDLIYRQQAVQLSEMVTRLLE